MYREPPAAYVVSKAAPRDSVRIDGVNGDSQSRRFLGVEVWFARADSWRMNAELGWPGEVFAWWRAL
jgi:hypothetical protein